MNRRELLRGLAAGAVGLAGCGSDDAQSTPPLPTGSTTGSPSTATTTNAPDRNDAGSSLPAHPRVFATARDFQRVRRLLATGHDHVGGWYRSVEASAEQLLDRSPEAYRLQHRGNLLGVSRSMLKRIRTLAMAYRVSGRERYAERAWTELDAAAAFEDWNPRHFLDVAEMTTAFAVGYDWLYGALDADRRARLRSAIVEKGLQPALASFDGTADVPTWWTRARNNWNAVCNAGISVGACALVGEEGVDQEMLGTLLEETGRSIGRSFASFGRDGGWPEGPTYWSYNTRYLVFYLSTLVNTAAAVDEPAVGSLDGPRSVGGFPATGDFGVQVIGPAGQFNFGDSSVSRGSMPLLFWLARQFDEPAWAAHQLNTVGLDGGGVLDLLWYEPGLAGPVDALPLDDRFDGVDVATFRSGRGDDAGFLAFKGGDNAASHADLDLGTFVYDVGGHRWAVDQGSDDYTLPGYFDADDRRWRYYRKRAEGHNTLVVDPGPGPDQRPSAVAPLVAFESGPAGGFGTIDLTSAYREAEFLRRGIAFDRDDRSVLVQDEIELSQKAPVWWFLHLPVAPSRIDAAGRTATVEQGTTRLRARILTPDDARFRVRSADPLPSSPDPEGQAANAGRSKLAVELRGVTERRLAVHLAPERENATPPAVRPLGSWSVDGVAGD